MIFSRRSALLLAIIFLAAHALLAQSASDPKSVGIISHIRRQPVASSAVASVGYGKHIHALEIEFVNGAIYRYLDVPVHVYRDLIAAESKARFYDENIRGKYRSIHVRRRRG